MPNTPFTKIRKRDGRIVPFNPLKITRAIEKAGIATGEFNGKEAVEITEKVLKAAQRQLRTDTPTVEEIQDLVEHALLTSPYKKTAKAYILYREQHTRIREIINQADVELIDGYLQKIDWEVKENSNMSYSLQGLNNYISSAITKKYWLNKIYTKDIAQAHEAGDLHIHDLQILATYCVGWDLIDLLTVGFQGASGKIQSSPAKHLRTAFHQIVNFFYTLTGECAGAQAFSNFDTLLAPFIYYDQLNYQEVKQCMQEFVFGMNVPTRVGFQTPFSNITLDLVVPKIYKDAPVIIGGQLQDKTYGEFQKEVDIFNKAFLEIMIEGDARGRVFTFPIPTYNLTKDFDWDNKELEPLWEVTAKYGVPYFANFVNSDMSPDDARSMCCRLRLDKRQLEKRGGGLFGANPLTGSIGVVTINMPRLAHTSKNKSHFFKQLDKLMDIAKESLETKRQMIEHYTDKGLYPYSRFYLRSVKQKTDQYWSNHFSTIGLIGMNEACENMYEVNIGTKKGRAFASEVLEHMREKLIEYQEKTGNHYNLEATPAEGVSFRFPQLDKEKYANIKVANEKNYQLGAKPYYTNSTQLPVNFTDDVFEAFELQDELQTKYTGGTVLHAFLGEKIDNIEAIKELVRSLVNHYQLPYFSITPTFSICPFHGYLSGHHDTCPECAKATVIQECEVYSRIVGYLRPVKQWNEGKAEEFKDRKTFVVSPMEKEQASK